MPGSPLKRAKRDAESALTADARSVGRRVPPPPTAKRAKPEPWNTDLCEEAVALGETGRSEAEIAAHWSLSVESVRRWTRDHAEFRDAMSRAATAARAWWEASVREAVATGDNRFPAGAWAQVMRARFPDYDTASELNVRVDVTERLVVIHRSAPPTLAIEGEAIESRAADAPALVRLRREDE